MHSGDGDISHSDVSIMPTANIKLVDLIHVHNVNNFTCVGADGLKDYVVLDTSVPFIRLRSVVVDNVKHLSAIQTLHLVGVGRLAELTLEVAPEVSSYTSSLLLDTFLSKPVL